MSNKNKKSKDVSVRWGWLIVFFAVFLPGLFYFVHLVQSVNEDEVKGISEGESNNVFCSDVCGYRLMSSNENVEFGFIRCVCTDNHYISASISSVSSKYTKEVHFFDSLSFENISYEDVVLRIRN